MIGLFRIHYFDPETRAMNMEAFNVTATSGERAIIKANKLKSSEKYKVERVECLGISDEP